MIRRLPDCLQTERLVLREPRAADARVLFETYTQDPEVAHFTTWKPHAHFFQTETFISDCIHAWSLGVRLPYVLALHGSEATPIGMIEARLSGHMVDLGYVLARRYWGQGLMPEAVCHFVDSVLATPTFFRVQATCDVDNRASARTLEKAGFVREARLERFTIHPNMSPEPRPCFLYARCTSA